METNRIIIKNNGTGRDRLFEELEKFATYQELSYKETLRLRLLAEELLGMVEEIVGDFGAYFWIEGEDKDVSLHLETYVEMDIAKREELLSVASSGKNMAARGVMGKLLETYLLNYDEVSRYAADSGMNPFAYDDYGMMNAGMDWSTNYWSLDRYRSDVEEHRSETEGARAWDELEKSIVAKLADDVLVGIRSDKVKMIIKKKF